MKSQFDSNPVPDALSNSFPKEELVSRRELNAHLQFRSNMDEMWRMGHLREHELMEIARSKAELQMKDKLTEMNALRSQIDQERGDYVTRDTLDSRVNTLLIQMEAIEKAGIETSKSLSNLTTRVMVTGTIMTSIFMALMAIAQLVWRK